MLSPAIRNWQQRPPSGGWDIDFKLKGQRWFLNKGGPFGIVEAIGEIQQVNGEFKGYGAIWSFCNKIWTKRDPKRALPFTDDAGKVYRPSGLPVGQVASQRYRPGCGAC